MKPYDTIADLLPFPLYPFQQDGVNELGPLPGAGLYFDTGIGKTPTSLAIAIYKLRRGDVHHVICIMPPVLITNWSRTLSKIPAVSHVCYRGSPKQRAAINLNAQFILVGYQIFKKDFDYLFGMFQDSTILVLCDEAQAVKNVGSQTYKKVRDMAVMNHILLLTGTPLSDPQDCYAYCKLVAPTIYKNLHQFENIHVATRDFFEKPTEWKNLDLLKENLSVNALRVLKEDVIKDLPAVTYTEMEYDLEPAHLKLYQRIAEEQIALLPDGEKLDFTGVNALLHALLQLPNNAEFFSSGEVRSTSLDLIDEIMDELGDKKLVVFTIYRMTNRHILEHCKKYGVVSVYGEISGAQKQENLDRFVADPTCRMIVLQVASGGVGLDGMQEVCSDMLFLELPYTAAAFHQAVARLYRVGQRLPVNVRIALAAKTLQFKVWDMVQERDSLINLCIRGLKDLRDAIAGK